MGYPYSNGDVLSHSDMNAVGLHLITPTSVTGGTLDGATVNISNGATSVTVGGAFSSDFDNYRILFFPDGFTVNNAGIQFKLGAATNGFYGQIELTPWNVTTPTRSSIGASSAFMVIGNTTTTGGSCSSVFDVMRPHQSARTQMYGQHYGNGYLGTFQASHELTTSYSDFTINPSTGTFVGTNSAIRVYGYSNG